MNTLTLSGWTQPSDALARLVPGSAHFDYSAYPSVEASFEGLKQYKDVPCLIGWSMGGQLALRAVAAGILQPKHLTLIATPWQFVSAYGMGRRTFELFHDTYAKDAASHKDRFHALIAKGDLHAKRILRELAHHPEVENTARWLPWLKELGDYSFDKEKQLYLPPTLIIHGLNDAIVPYAQALKIQSVIPSVTVSTWASAGHAPHLHDTARFLEEISMHRAQMQVAA